MKEAIRHLLACPHDVPLIAFIGDISRTWYVDISMLGYVMEILRETRLYRPIRGGPWGFDMRVGEQAAIIGLVEYAVDAFYTKKSYTHDVGMLDGACMVVAFPREAAAEVDEFGRVKKGAVPRQWPWEEIEPPLTEAIKMLNIPVLAVRRDGATEWSP